MRSRFPRRQGARLEQAASGIARFDQVINEVIFLIFTSLE
jgi:hypothetical protein